MFDVTSEARFRTWQQRTARGPAPEATVEPGWIRSLDNSLAQMSMKTKRTDSTQPLHRRHNMSRYSQIFTIRFHLEGVSLLDGRSHGTLWSRENRDANETPPSFPGGLGTGEIPLLVELFHFFAIPMVGVVLLLCPR